MARRCRASFARSFGSFWAAASWRRASLALLDFYARRAEERGIPHARTGAVTFVQRFGSSLNLNLHLPPHALDGVFTERPDGTLVFHALQPPSTKELRVLVSVVRSEVLRYAVQHGLLDDDTAVTDHDAPVQRVMRYCLRPPLSHQRLERLPDGRIRLALKPPWSDGTSHMIFEPLEFIDDDPNAAA